MRYIISAILCTIAGELDKFAARICKDMGCEVVIFASLEEITQALTPPSAPGELPGVDVLDQVENVLQRVME